DLEPLAAQVPGQFQNGGRLPRPQEAADHDVARFGHELPVDCHDPLPCILSIVASSNRIYPCTSTLLGSGVPRTKYSHPRLYGSLSMSVVSRSRSGFPPSNVPSATLYRSVSALNPSTQPIVWPTRIGS